MHKNSVLKWLKFMLPCCKNSLRKSVAFCHRSNLSQAPGCPLLSSSLTWAQLPRSASRLFHLGGCRFFFQVLKILVNHRWACWCCPNLVCKRHKSWLTYGNTTMIWCTCCDSNPDEIDRMNDGNPSHSHCPRFKHPLGALFWPANFINNGPVSTFVDAQARKMCWNVWSWPWCRSRSRLSGEFLLPSLGYDINGIGTVPATIFDPSPVSSFFIRGWMIRPSHGYVTMYVVHVSVMFL